MNTLWLTWHGLPPMGHAAIIAAIAGAFIAGLFGILIALIKDHLRKALIFAVLLLLLFGGVGAALFYSYRPPPTPPSPFFAPKSLDANLSFVYVTTDQPANLTTARQIATRIRAKLERSDVQLPVHVYVKQDQSRSAVGIGEPAQAEEAQKTLNRVVRAGWPKAARNPANGWVQVE